MPAGTEPIPVTDQIETRASPELVTPEEAKLVAYHWLRVEAGQVENEFLGKLSPYAGNTKRDNLTRLSYGIATALTVQDQDIDELIKQLSSINELGTLEPSRKRRLMGHILNNRSEYLDLSAKLLPLRTLRQAFVEGLSDDEYREFVRTSEETAITIEDRLNQHKVSLDPEVAGKVEGLVNSDPRIDLRAQLNSDEQSSLLAAINTTIEAYAADGLGYSRDKVAPNDLHELDSAIERAYTQAIRKVIAEARREEVAPTPDLPPAAEPTLPPEPGPFVRPEERENIRTEDSDWYKHDYIVVNDARGLEYRGHRLMNLLDHISPDTSEYNQCLTETYACMHLQEIIHTARLPKLLGLPPVEKMPAPVRSAFNNFSYALRDRDFYSRGYTQTVQEAFLTLRQTLQEQYHFPRSLTIPSTFANFFENYQAMLQERHILRRNNDGTFTYERHKPKGARDIGFAPRLPISLSGRDGVEAIRFAREHAQNPWDGEVPVRNIEDIYAGIRLLDNQIMRLGANIGRVEERRQQQDYLISLADEVHKATLPQLFGYSSFEAMPDNVRQAMEALSIKIATNYTLANSDFSIPNPERRKQYQAERQRANEEMIQGYISLWRLVFKDTSGRVDNAIIDTLDKTPVHYVRDSGLALEARHFFNTRFQDRVILEHHYLQRDDNGDMVHTSYPRIQFAEDLAAEVDGMSDARFREAGDTFPNPRHMTDRVSLDTMWGPRSLYYDHRGRAHKVHNSYHGRPIILNNSQESVVGMVGYTNSVSESIYISREEELFNNLSAGLRQGASVISAQKALRRFARDLTRNWGERGMKRGQRVNKRLISRQKPTATIAYVVHGSASSGIQERIAVIQKGGPESVYLRDVNGDIHPLINSGELERDFSSHSITASQREEITRLLQLTPQQRDLEVFTYARSVIEGRRNAFKEGSKARKRLEDRFALVDRVIANIHEDGDYGERDASKHLVDRDRARRVLREFLPTYLDKLAQYLQGDTVGSNRQMTQVVYPGQSIIIALGVPGEVLAAASSQRESLDDVVRSASLYAQRYKASGDVHIEAIQII